nr:MAG: hypothetical protein [Microvirus sp.]
MIVDMLDISKLLLDILQNYQYYLEKKQLSEKINDLEKRIEKIEHQNRELKYEK